MCRQGYPISAPTVADILQHQGYRLQANRKTREGLTEIEWPQIDFDARLIRLRAGHTKGGKPRTCPFLGNMEEILLAAKKDRDTYWPECPWVFHRLGQPLLDFRGAWDTACQRAGLQDLEFHDLRRSGVRNLSRAKVPETIIMKITGHRTRAMFDRYNSSYDCCSEQSFRRDPGDSGNIGARNTAPSRSGGKYDRLQARRPAGRTLKESGPVY